MLSLQLLLYQLFKYLHYFLLLWAIALAIQVSLITILRARLLVCQQWPLLQIWELNPCDVLFIDPGHSL